MALLFALQSQQQRQMKTLWRMKLLISASLRAVCSKQSQLARRILLQQQVEEYKYTNVVYIYTRIMQCLYSISVQKDHTNYALIKLDAK